MKLLFCLFAYVPLTYLQKKQIFIKFSREAMPVKLISTSYLLIS
jgi:hypothetical protein